MEETENSFNNVEKFSSIIFDSANGHTMGGI